MSCQSIAQRSTLNALPSLFSPISLSNFVFRSMRIDTINALLVTLLLRVGEVPVAMIFPEGGMGDSSLSNIGSVVGDNVGWGDDQSKLPSNLTFNYMTTPPLAPLCCSTTTPRGSVYGISGFGISPSCLSFLAYHVGPIAAHNVGKESAEDVINQVWKFPSINTGSMAAKTGISNSRRKHSRSEKGRILAYHDGPIAANNVGKESAEDVINQVWTFPSVNTGSMAAKAGISNPRREYSWSKEGKHRNTSEYTAVIDNIIKHPSGLVIPVILLASVMACDLLNAKKTKSTRDVDCGGDIRSNPRSYSGRRRSRIGTETRYPRVSNKSPAARRRRRGRDEDEPVYTTPIKAATRKTRLMRSKTRSGKWMRVDV